MRNRSVCTAQRYKIQKRKSWRCKPCAYVAFNNKAFKTEHSLPATTALGTVDPLGREKGILHGANVVMPNLSPVKHRKDYSLYDNKICTGDEAAQCIGCLADRMEKIGYEIVTDRGDYTEE